MKKDLGIQAIIDEYGIQARFTRAALAEAANTPGGVSPADMEGRTDYRSQPAITIDGADAKDLDDAVFLEKTAKGWTLYVHIADVARYVQSGQATDRDAFARGTSVYFADRVIPMLPVELSNGICSLNAGEDRLAVSCVMELSADGRVLDGALRESVINVKERMTYSAVLEILENGAGPPMLFEMEKLAGVLRENRRKRGAIELASSECKFTLDEKGFPVDIERAAETAATSIIEEFMILCNEVVARTMSESRMPLLYRVHDSSPPEKLDRFYALARALKIRKAKRAGAYGSKAVQAVIELAGGGPYEEIINRAALGCMRQAVYSARNTGHYGLASQCYCHFTSPIRRYPDLFCHRMVKAFLRGGLSKEDKTELKQALPEQARHLSAMERRAAEAEREVTSLLKIHYMSDKLGRKFPGRITGVQKWGMYVELPNTVEGLVSYRDMRDDFYIFDEGGYRVIGERRKRIYRLGDAVRVCAVEADTEKRRLDFVII